MLGKNEGYCNCGKSLQNGTYKVGQFHKVKIDDEGWCTRCGHYALQGKLDQRGLNDPRGERNFKTSTRAGKNRWNYSYESIWGSQPTLTVNLTYNTESDNENTH